MNNEPGLETSKDHGGIGRNWLLMMIPIVFVGGIIVMAAYNPSTIQPSQPPDQSGGITQPPPPDPTAPIAPTQAQPTTQISKEDNVGPKWDYVSLTPEIFNGIIQKIKRAPNAEIKATISEENSSVTFYYSFVTHDPCEPLLKDFIVFEMKIIAYADENGQRYPNGPITDYYSMRDIDHDNFPEDYFTPGEPNPDAKICDQRYVPLTEDTPDIDNLLSYWEAGMNYFAGKLLK